MKNGECFDNIASQPIGTAALCRITHQLITLSIMAKLMGMQVLRNGFT